MSRFYRKQGIGLSLILICALVGVFIGAVATVHRVARAEGAAVEVNNAAVPATESASVIIWVRNFPEDEFGLGCYTIRIDYDPTMIEVTGVSPGDAPFDAPTYNIYADYVSITQFIVVMPGPTGDIRICDLEFTCLEVGETTLALTIETLANTNGDEIPATSINGTITQQGNLPPTQPEVDVTPDFHLTTDNSVWNITTANGEVTLRAPQGTEALDRDGNPLEKITLDPVSEPPNRPEGAHIIGLACDLGPDGATFDPLIELTIRYDPKELPEGVNEGDLVIASYDSDLGEWVLLPSVVDAAAHTVTASIGHFTVFAIIGRKEATFDFANLSISPSTVDPRESITISAEVINRGGIEGSHTVTLLIDGEEEATQELTLAPGASDTVSFAVTRDEAGTYEVTVDGQSGSFTVTEEEFPWWAVWLGAGVFLLAVAAVAAYLLMWRRRRATA